MRDINGRITGKILKEVLFMNEMVSITEVAKMLGLSPRTIERWEETGKIKKAKRDERGWRVYDRDDTERLMAFHIAHHFHGT